MNFFFYYIIAYVLGLALLYAYMKARSTTPALSELTWTGILSTALGVGGAYALWKLGFNHWIFVVLYGFAAALLTYKFLDGKK